MRGGIMVKEIEGHPVSRRNFVKGTFAGAVVGAGALGGASMFGCAPKSEEAAAPEAAEETIAWSQCNVNCGGNCVFQWHVKDGKIQYMESETRAISTSRRVPACAAVLCVVG